LKGNLQNIKINTLKI